MYIHVSIQLDMFTDLHSFTFLFNDPKFCLRVPLWLYVAKGRMNGIYFPPNYYYCKKKIRESALESFSCCVSWEPSLCFLSTSACKLQHASLGKLPPKKIGVLKLSQQKFGQWNSNIGNWKHQICLILILVDGSEIPFPTTVWMYPQTSVDNGR